MHGKRANLVVTAGHILQPSTDVKALFIGGKPLAPEAENEQMQLYARWQEHLAKVQAGIEPLGLDPVPAPSRTPAPSSPSPAPMPPLTGPNTPAANPAARR